MDDRDDNRQREPAALETLAEPRPRGGGRCGGGLGHGFALTPAAALAGLELIGSAPSLTLDLVRAQAALGPDARLELESGGDAAVVDPDATNRSTGR